MNFRRIIAGVTPTPEEISTPLPGDELIDEPPFELNRGMTLPVSADELTGWVAQIGKRSEGRAGWYLPRGIECWLPPKYRALQWVDPALALRQGQEIGDWMSFGKPHMLTATIVDLEKRFLVLTGLRLGGYSWALAWDEIAPGQTRLVMRMRARKFGWVERPINKLEMLLVCGTFHAGLTQRLNRLRRAE